MAIIRNNSRTWRDKCYCSHVTHKCRRYNASCADESIREYNTLCASCTLKYPSFPLREPFITSTYTNSDIAIYIKKSQAYIDYTITTQILQSLPHNINNLSTFSNKDVIEHPVHLQISSFHLVIHQRSHALL